MCVGACFLLLNLRNVRCLVFAVSALRCVCFYLTLNRYRCKCSVFKGSVMEWQLFTLQFFRRCVSLFSCAENIASVHMAVQEPRLWWYSVYKHFLYSSVECVVCQRVASLSRVNAESRLLLLKVHPYSGFSSDVNLTKYNTIQLRPKCINIRALCSKWYILSYLFK